MGFVAAVPSPPLGRVVARIWDHESDAPLAFGLERVLPTPAAGLIVNLAEDSTRAWFRDVQGEWQCEHRAGGLFCGAQSRGVAIDTQEQQRVMGVVFQPGAAADLIQRAPQVARIAAVARTLGISERRLGELFREQVGMAPKRYARIARFRRLVENTDRRRPIAWAEVAVDAGLHDQAHLVHEFRAFAGVTPGAWAAHAGPHDSHVPL